jgi:SAM-dependent methyltransferase
VYRFMLQEHADRSRPFLSQYRSVRRADGHSAAAAASYATLPVVPPGSPNAAEWRIRRRSFHTAVARGGLRTNRRRRVLDVGAGNGWLSSRLSELGHEAVAVDLDDDAGDGLRAAAPREPFPLVQADFDAMPFAPGQFDLVLMNASLHYSPEPEHTVEAAARLLRAGGTLMVMDSPMFEDPADGEAMVAQQLEALRTGYSLEQPIRPGVGFLTFAGLQRMASRIGRGARFFASHGPVLWRLRRTLSARRLGRAPAAFGVWVAR